ncbi:cytochrome P450 [Leptodontidium sp. MPI-SDFR-AT-0119]|nr:cytochrome P450 [Leptodontidium sp. MPI-SDFR-AT-0119]
MVIDFGYLSLLFIGRVYDVPSVATWLKFWEWSKLYGPIYQMEIFGSVHVIANDLLSTRGTIYSDRPTIPNLPDNRTSRDYLALLGRTSRFQKHGNVNAKSPIKSCPAQQSNHFYNYLSVKFKRLLYQMSKDPSNYISHIEQHTSGTISRLSWGAPHFANELRIGTFGLLATISPSGAVPNIVSWLSHLPTWLSHWQQVENAQHAREGKFFRHCHESVKSAIANGIAAPSYMKVFLEEKEKGKHEMCDEEGQYIVGTMAIAGALTIGSPLQSYILAMCHYPEWQEKRLVSLQSLHLPTKGEAIDHSQYVESSPPLETAVPDYLEGSDEESDTGSIDSIARNASFSYLN